MVPASTPSPPPTPPASLPRWDVTAADAGTRLDKFLAGAGRVGSRSRVVTALAHGRVFVNEAEAAPADAALRLTAGDRVCVWTQGLRAVAGVA